MQQELISEIEVIEKKIEHSLQRDDFVLVSQLSLELDQLVKKLISDMKIRGQTKVERIALTNLLSTVDNLKISTIEKFKSYTSRVSQQTKMHEAYKQ